MKVTVAICTWNRADLLDRTLSEMGSLRIPEGVEWELLIVNNNCTDHTDEILARHAGKLPLRHLFEPKQGLSYARNCAVAAAEGELILWTDDDVLVDPAWMAEYVAAAQDWPEAMFFGGTIEPWFGTQPSPWIRNNLDLLVGPYALGRRGDAIRLLDLREMAIGANMACRREAYREVMYNPDLGRVGNRLTSGEDSEFCNRLRHGGALGLWVGTARVRHYIPPERLTRNYLGRWFRGFGATVVRMEDQSQVPQLLGVPRWVFRAYLNCIVKSWIFAALRNRSWLDNFKRARIMEGIIIESLRFHT